MSYREHCPCGSGQPAVIAADARGIPIGYVCNECEERKMRKYRPEIFTDPNYTVDEQIDPDE